MGDKCTKINEILGVKESYQAPAVLMSTLYDREKREGVFNCMLELFDYDVSFDWFHDYFQNEHADRKKKKQDFTPTGLADTLARIVGGDRGTTTADIAAGTGGITIRKWRSDRLRHSPMDYYPSYYLYHCEELSDRALPFLLFNLLIRGMNATVVHGDTLSRRKIRGVFFVQNDFDDHLRFSSLNLMPYSEGVRDEFGIISWADEKDRHKPIKETTDFPQHLLRGIKSILSTSEGGV